MNRQARPGGRRAPSHPRYVYHIDVPCEDLCRGELGRLEFLAAEGLGAEVTFFDTRCLLFECAERIVHPLADKLRALKIPVSAHGAIYNLDPGSLDPFIREHTLRCYMRSLEAASWLGARTLVLHTGYNPLLPRGTVEPWCRSVCEALGPLFERAEELELPVCLENTYEEDPAILLELARGRGNKYVGFCLDVAHIHVGRKAPLDDWFNAFGRRLKEMHLADNRGDSDDHLPLGEGTVDFRAVFRELAARRLRPVMTIEASFEHALASRAFLDSLTW